MGREDEYFWKTAKEREILPKEEENDSEITTFLDNLGNDQHQKMLREISNDDITPKKT